MATTITPTAAPTPAAPPTPVPTVRTEIASSAPAASKNEAGAADRFLKLLVAQMQNQDPLKPMDNAQVTSQMAQIQTVSGIEQLNKNIQGMTSQFSAMQSLQGASLVGRGVMIEGNTMMFDESGTGSAGFELESTAERVRVDVTTPAGTPLGSIELGAQGAGRHTFEWKPAAGVDLSKGAVFRVTATAGANVLKPTLLTQDVVESVVTGGPTLMLELAGKGPLPYSQIKVFN